MTTATRPPFTPVVPIRVTDRKTVRTRLVRGRSVGGGLGVTNASGERGGWVVTHFATGCRVNPWPLPRDKALGLARTLRDSFPWDQLDPEDPCAFTKRHGADVAAIVKGVK